MIVAKKNAAYYLSFPAVDSTTPASYKTGISPVDTAYSKDGAGAWTSLAITDTAAEIGSTGVYEIDLTAAEMNHDKVFIKFAVSGMADDGYMFDLPTKLTDDLQDVAATAIVSSGAITTAAGAVSNVTTVATTTTNSDMITAAAVNAEVDTALADIYLDHLVFTATAIPAVTAGTFLDQIMDDGTATFDRTTDSLQAIKDNAAWDTATGFSTHAATDIVSAGAITTLTGAVVNVDLVDVLTTYTGNTKQTADHTAAIAAIPTTAMRGTDNAATEAKQDIIDTSVDTLLEGLILQSTTIATLATQVSFTLTAGSADATAYEGATIVVIDAATATQKAFGSISAYSATTRTVTLAQDPSVFTMAIGDTVHVLPSDVFAIWDRVLTGATHNIATSAGRRLRGVQEFQGYEGGFIYVDLVSGTAGTVDFENGTVENPVDTLADALTLSTSLGFKKLFFENASSITLTSTMNNFVLSGVAWTIALGGQDIGGTSIFNAHVSGTGTGSSEINFSGCHLGTCTLAPFHAVLCALDAGTITLSDAGDYVIADSHSGVAGASTPIIDMGAAVLGSNLTMPHYFNGVEIRNFNSAGTDRFSISGAGQVIYAASSSGTVNQRGDWKVTNTGGVTITSDDNTTGVAAILVDTTAIKGDLPQVPTTGVAFSNFTFLMVLASDHVTPATGLTFLAANSQRSIDSAAFGNTTNIPTEISAGVYTVDLSAADMAGSNTTTLKFTGTAADQRTVTLPMQPT